MARITEYPNGGNKTLTKLILVSWSLEKSLGLGRSDGALITRRHGKMVVGLDLIRCSIF